MMERPAPTVAEVREALARLLASPSFGGSKRSGNMLRYVVEAALTDPTRVIKEHELGVEGLGRGEGYDPRFDPIARVEASRLRSRLDQYYAAEGAGDPILIELPKGGYSPAFGHRAPKANAAPAAAVPAAAASSWRSSPIAWGAGGLAIAAVLFAVIGLLFPPPFPAAPQRNVATFDAALGAPGVLSDQVGNSLVLSPDGSTLVMHVLLDDGSTRLFVRRLESPQATELPGTSGSFQPFFSPDGKWVGFFSSGKLRKTLADGGSSPVELGDAGDIQGLAWGSDGNIYACSPHNQKMRLRRIPEAGGAWTTVPVEFGDDGRCGWPSALPDGQGLLFSVLSEKNGPSRIEASRLDGSGRTIIANGGAFARYSPSGHVLYVDRGTLFAVDFDIETFTTKGTPRPVLRDVSYREPFWYAHFDIAGDGTLVYLRSALSRIDWLDGGARRRPLLSEPGRYWGPRLSPNGRQLAYSVSDGPVYRLYLLDLASGQRQRMGTDDSNEGGPSWTPDGRNLLVTMYGTTAIGWRKPGSTDVANKLIEGRAVPWSFAPAGRRLAFYMMDEATHFDLWTVPIESGPDGVKAGEPEVFLKTPAVETYPAFSPDGKWLAYNSNESGDFDIYVRSFPDKGRQVKLSTAGGRMAIWSRTSNEIFYTTNDHRVMVAPWSVRDGEFIPGAPRLFAEQQLSSVGVIPNYDLAPDGKSVVGLVPALTEGRRDRDHISVVVNFADQLSRPQPN